VVLATTCLALAVGVYFFASFEALVSGTGGKSAGNYLRGVGAILGEDAARYLAALFFAGLAVLILRERVPDDEQLNRNRDT
jgi:hypothetical protein